MPNFENLCVCQSSQRYTAAKAEQRDIDTLAQGGLDLKSQQNKAARNAQDAPLADSLPVNVRYRDEAK